MWDQGEVIASVAGQALALLVIELSLSSHFVQ